MKRSLAANLALIVSLVPSVLFFFALGNAMGDFPEPRTPEEAHATTVFTDAAMIGLLLALIACGWLSGYGYTEAPYRSLFAICIAAGTMIAIGIVL
jgi:peptidoglycan/LPS O-acetylase OafA/YrhL